MFLGPGDLLLCVISPRLSARLRVPGPGFGAISSKCLLSSQRQSVPGRTWTSGREFSEHSDGRNYHHDNAESEEHPHQFIRVRHAVLVTKPLPSGQTAV